MKKIILLSISFTFISLSSIAQDNVFPLPNGNVGIGTNNPQSKLHIKDPEGGAALRVERGGKSWNFSIQNTGNSLFLNNSDHTNTFFTFKKEGNFGIGTTSPFSPLQVNSALDGILTLQTTDNAWLYTNYLDNTGTRKTWMGLDATLSSFNINVENGADKILFNGGNVGIGTSAPSSKLHVAGNGAVIKLQNTSYEDTDNAFYGWLGGYDKSGDEIWWLGEGSGSSKTLGFYTNRDGYDLNLAVKGKGIIIKNGGNVGIGTNNPVAKLEIKGIGDGVEILKLSTERPWVFKQEGTGASSNLVLQEISGNKFFKIKSYNNTDIYTIQSNTGDTYFKGKMGIGTTDTKGYKLAVAGKVVAEEVKVALQNSWPDYVFEDSYYLPTLKEVENHIHDKGHLPNIPSAKVVEKEGIQLGEMNAKLLQKIEELTLYMIQQNKKTENLIKEVKVLKEKNAELEQKIK